MTDTLLLMALLYPVLRLALTGYRAARLMVWLHRGEH